jgi:TrmH family RNA methyltransferase
MSIPIERNGLVPGNVFFILVRPIYLGNIGSAARVLKNFGFRNLRFVQPPRGYRDSEARRMSVDAFDVLKESRVFESVDEALKDINIAIGTTSAQQRSLEPALLDTVSPSLIAATHNSNVAFLFGDERNGLLKDELQRCHHIITIPTDPQFAAMNLSQAIAVCAYEMIRAGSASIGDQKPLTTGEADDVLFKQLDLMLDAVGFTKSFNRTNIISELRTLYQRAHPTEREYDLLKGALHKINDALNRSSSS